MGEASLPRGAPPLLEDGSDDPARSGHQCGWTDLQSGDGRDAGAHRNEDRNGSRRIDASTHGVFSIGGERGLAAPDRLHNHPARVRKGPESEQS